MDETLSTEKPPQPLSRPRWMVLVTVVLSMLLVALVAVGWTGYVDSEREASEREADRRWCQLLNTLDEAYSTVPPTSELGRRVANAIHTLRVDLDC